MATELIQMGATELIQLGDLRYLGQANTPTSSPVVGLFRLVDYMENPFAGIEIEPGESVSAKQRAIGQQLQTASRIVRKNLVREANLGDYSYSQAMSESMRLAAILNEMGDQAIALGKFKLGKKLKKIGKKIVKVVKSPAFLSVVGVIANVIPGVGQVASAALLTTAGIMAKKQQEAKQKKAMKKAEQQAAAEAATQDETQLNAYYAQYGPTYMHPLGYTPDVWAKMSVADKRKAVEALAQGTLQPTQAAAQQAALVDPAARQQVVSAAAMSVAMKDVYGNQLPGQGIDISQYPPDVQAQIRQQAPEIQKQIMTVGKDNFLATAQKAAGQGGAIDALYKGLGMELPGSEAFGKVGGNIFAAGVQDVENSGASVGAGGVVSTAMDKGRSGEFPILPIAAAAGGIGLTILVLVLADVF